VSISTGCAPVSILNGITPSSTFDKTKDVAYGPSDHERLDIYRADDPKAESPVIIFIHGGSWDSGSKDIYKFLAEGFTRSGYDIVVPNYRLYPDAAFPNFLEDNAKAAAYVAKEFPSRPLVLMGHSAGAYNVLMLGLRDEYLSSAGEVYPGQSHIDVIKVLSRHFDDDTTLKADITNFINTLPKDGNFCR